MIRRLEGNWQIATDPENVGRKEQWCSQVLPTAQPAPVPGIIQQVFPGYHGVAWYWHAFTLPQAPAAEERVLLTFGAVDYLAEVWVNGQAVGGYEGGETPFTLDITDAVHVETENLLTVRVLNPTYEPIDGYVLPETPHRNRTTPPRCGCSFDNGGIMYPVELQIVPAVHITDLLVRPDAETGRIAVTVTVENTGSNAAAMHASFTVASANGGVDEDRVDRDLVCLPGESRHQITLTVAQPRRWNLDDPALYRVTATVGAHAVSARCGFRDFRVVDGFFYLNGKRLFLKSTHTGNHTPIGQQLAVLPDHVRRDLLNAKASGFNCVRFIGGVAWPEQLDCCDEIGLLVIEECLAGWCLADSPHLAERFTRNTAAMLHRDRNHPSIAMWGLLNETFDSPTFEQAVDFLPTLRALDPTRVVLLASGRWDRRPNIGSVSNPGSDHWEPTWGAENEQPVLPECDWEPGGYSNGAGDAHVYPRTPQDDRDDTLIRTLGKDMRPVFLSEYGIGSMMNIINELRHFEQVGARADLEDMAMLRVQAEAFMADWQRLGFDDVYPFPEDLLRESQRLHARQRTHGFNCIRSNPQMVGYNLTGMLDHGMTGEGLWTFWREWKPATFEAVRDGWSPLRWCLFANPMHVYAGQEFTVEAVLANEDVLPPGEYAATFRMLGPQGVAWEKAVTFTVNEQFAVPVLRETITLDGAAGQYTFAAALDGGGAPTGDRLHFYCSRAEALPQLHTAVATWGVDEASIAWLTAHGVNCVPFNGTLQAEIILVGLPDEEERTKAMWSALTAQVQQGAIALCLCPQAFQQGEDSTHWLPLEQRGRWIAFDDWLYHKECVARRHPVFAGLPGPGILDWDYYGPVIPKEIYEDLPTPDETIVASFATGHPYYETGYGCGLLIAAYRVGKGTLLLSTPHLLENLGTHPAADRLLLNLIAHALGLQAGKNHTEVLSEAHS